MDIEFTMHAAERQVEREISEEQVLDAILHPDASRAGRANTTVHFKRIRVSDGPRVPAGRFLKVVVNDTVKPSRVVSLHPVRKMK